MDQPVLWGGLVGSLLVGLMVAIAAFVMVTGAGILVRVFN
jgi:hypothetical protein